MRAVCWHGRNKVGVEDVPDPKILNPHDAIVQISTTAICGSDLHLYGGRIPSLCQGDILGHEFMGEVVEVGPDVKRLKVGDRVVVPFNIACGRCLNCKRQLFAACDNSNPGAWALEQLNGVSSSGLFGYTHLYGGYAGGQAEYARVPFADVGPLKVPDGLADEQVLFLSDIFPTGYMAAENCGIKRGDVVAIWGLGPVGQFAVRSALMLGADRVIGIDRIPERLAMAGLAGSVELIDFEKDDVHEILMEKTGGQGPDACIDAVGMEAHGASPVRLSMDRMSALKQALFCCRKGGTVSIPGVYAGVADQLNLGAAFGKGLTLKMGQTHTHRYMRPLLERILGGEIDPSFVISHRLTLEDAPRAYDLFQKKEQACTKVVLRPRAQTLH